MTDLEMAVMVKFLDGDHSTLKALRQQLASCRVDKREFTGAGFYTDFVVDNSVVDQLHGDFNLDEVIAEIDGLKHGAGFVLYVRNGMLQSLEGYSYDEPWPEKISGFKLRFMQGENRDWQALISTLEKQQRKSS
jgi:hypothetical protein